MKNNRISVILLSTILLLGGVPLTQASSTGGFKATSIKSSPFWATPVQDSLFWSTDVTPNAFWSTLTQGSLFWSTDNVADIFWSTLITNDIFWSTAFQASPFWSTGLSGQPFWSTGLEGDIFWSTGVGAQIFFSTLIASLNDQSNFDAAIFWSTLIEGSPFWSTISADPFWSTMIEANPFWSTIFFSTIFWSTLIADPFWSTIFFSTIFWSTMIEANPFWSTIYWSTIFFSTIFWSTSFDASIFWSTLTGSIYWSTLIEASPFWSTLVASPFWSTLVADPFWSTWFISMVFLGSPFWSTLVASPFWSTDFSATPFWSTIFEGSPFWSTDLSGQPFWSTILSEAIFWSTIVATPFWSTIYWSTAFYALPFWSTGDDFSAKDVKRGLKDLYKMFDLMLKSVIEGAKDYKHYLKHELKEADDKAPIREELSNVRAFLDGLREFRHDFREIKHTIKEIHKNWSEEEVRSFILSQVELGVMDGEIPWGVDRVTSDYEVGGEGVQVAVLDTGVDPSHPDLAGRVTWMYDATGTGLQDLTGHGTHVAGTIAAAYDGNGVAGVASGAEIYGIKVLAGQDMIGEYEWFADGIYAAVYGPDGVLGTEDDADVISMSFDSQGELPPAYVYDAIRFAYDQGVVLVAAAGNGGDGDLSTLEQDTWPAAYDEVIAVGSTNILDQVSTFSNTASYLELVAPGEYILSTYLDGNYAVWAGTSMATPHVSGVVALLISEYGRLPVGSFGDMGDDTIRGLLHSMAYQFGTSAWTAYSGYGLVQY